jgi:N-acetyl-anhydromuramyl-L-alanine amidase AmpD
MSATSNYIQARYYHHANRERVDYLVIHTMELPCRAGMAQRLGERFRDCGPERPVSAHFGIDPEAVFQYVRESDVAWHCPKCNSRGVGLEHAGYAIPPRQAGRVIAAATDWDSPEGRAVLERSAALAARLCVAWAIPVVHLNPEALTRGQRGLVGHADATRAYPGSGTHVDPGPAWPWDKYLQLISAYHPS